MPSYLLPLFRSIRAVVIANDIRPAYYSASRGAIYLDPDFVWLTPEEGAVVSDEPDYRSKFGVDLQYRFHWRLVNADGPLRVRRDANGSPSFQPWFTIWDSCWCMSWRTRRTT